MLTALPTDRSTRRPSPAPPARARAALASRRAASPRARRAFSLVELVVVLTIISVVSGMGVVRYASSLSRYRADLAAKRLAADIALAQARARATSQATLVRFSVSGNAYQLPGETIGSASAPTAVSLADPTIAARLISVTIDSGGSDLGFDGFGQPLAGAVVRLGVGAQTRTITVHAATGAVLITTP